MNKPNQAPTMSIRDVAGATDVNVSQSFADRADSAAFYEGWVSAVLSRCGLYVLHRPFVVDGSKEHDLSVDISVGVEASNAGQATLIQNSADVEIKSLNLDFKNPFDYPYDEVLLCSQSSFLKKWPGAYKTERDFLMVSRVTGAILWVPKRTDVMFGKEIYDSKRGELYRAVAVQRKFLRPLKGFVSELKN